jgi:DNA-binding NtrC family response regulator
MTVFKLMLVDDEIRFLQTTQKVLERKGFEVLTATGGQGALEVLDKQIVPVVILDVKMPGMDGVETLKAIKAFHPLVEVIMLTGNATVKSAIEGLKAGAFDYLMKPCDIDVLVNKAEEAHSKRVMMEEKIRAAQLRLSMKSPREILKQTREV